MLRIEQAGRGESEDHVGTRRGNGPDIMKAGEKQVAVDGEAIAKHIRRICTCRHAEATGPPVTLFDDDTLDARQKQGHDTASVSKPAMLRS